MFSPASQIIAVGPAEKGVHSMNMNVKIEQMGILLFFCLFFMQRGSLGIWMQALIDFLLMLQEYLKEVELLAVM